jgi:hypothetical protein
MHSTDSHYLPHTTQMNILNISDEEFEQEIAPYCEMLKQAARKARHETQDLWMKW